MDMPKFFGFSDRRSALHPIVFILFVFCSSLTQTALAVSSMQRIDSAQYADPARIATDDAGNAIAVWTQFDALPSRAGVWTNRYVAHRGWGTPQLINDSPDQASDPRIAMNARGDAIVVWTQYNNSTPFKSNIWANRYSKETGWSSAQQIEDDTANAYAAKVGIDAEGNALAVWAQNDAALDRTHIYANRYTVEKGWGNGVPLQSDVTVLANEPQIAMDAKGDATVIWTQFTAPQNGVWTSRYTVDRGWDVAQRIGDETVNSPVVAVDDRGGAMAAWLQLNTTSYLNNVFARHYVNGQWEPLVPVQQNTQTDAPIVQLAMNARGDAVALWEERSADFGAIPAVYASDYTHAHGWDNAVRIDDSTQWTNASLAIDEDDNVAAVWERDNSVLFTQNIYVYRHGRARAWDSGELIGPAQDNAGYPQLSASDNGTTALVWQLQDSTGASQLWGDVFATAPPHAGH